MFLLNKIAWAIGNPMMIAIVVAVLGCVILRHGWQKSGWSLLMLSFVFLWIVSTGALSRQLGGRLEREFLVPDDGACVKGGRIPDVADVPSADAIVLLGGGMCAVTNASPIPDMKGSADRVWYSARLWHAGKAPIIIPSGPGIVAADVRLLLDLGVSRDAIITEDVAKNTEENARFVSGILSARDSQCTNVLLVTSSWHMKRSLLMFEKYAPELRCIPAATDFESTMDSYYSTKWTDFIPCPNALADNSKLLHECLGYWWYKLFR